MAYFFGVGGDKGSLSLELEEDEWKDTTKDHILFGFVTNQSNTVLLRVESDISNDFIEFEIVSLCVFVFDVIFFEKHHVSMFC